MFEVARPHVFALVVSGALALACAPASQSSGGGGKSGAVPTGGAAGASASAGGSGGANSGGANSGGATAKGGASGSSAGGRGGSVTSAGSGGAGAGGAGDSGSGGRSSKDAAVPDSRAADDAGGIGTGGLVLSGLKIEANPKNVLSCFVSWKTDKASSSTVQFGAGKYEWEISDSKLVTDHKVLVIGMHASQTYMIKALSTASAGTASAEDKFTTGSLPATIPVGTVSAMDKTKMQAGWTLMNIQKGDGTPTARSKVQAQAVMFDADGKPVWYHIHGTSVDRGGATPVELTDKGVLIGAVMNDNLQNAEPPREVDFAGNTVWECSTPTCNGPGTLTHHVAKLRNGNYVIQSDVQSTGNTAPVFQEITADGKVVWSLDYRKMVPQPQGTSGDWCHGNSITVDIENNAVYANCRFIGLIKTTYQNPTLQWLLPAAFNGKGLSGLAFSPPSSQYSDTHDPEIHDDGTILFFDNGGYSGTIEEGNPRGYHSRAVEYKIDETAKTATLVWEFPGTFNVDAWYKTQFYLPFWGDANRLPNGNVLIAAGRRGTTVQSRVFEVTKQDGKVVWEFQLPLDFGVYRAHRLPTPPLVRAITP